MKKILLFAFVISLLFSGLPGFSINCDFRDITVAPCTGAGETPIVSFERENGTSIMSFNDSLYDYALCCNGLSSDIATSNYGIIPRRDYWQNPTAGCNIYHTMHCDYPDMYNINPDAFVCDRGFVNISMMFDEIPPITPHTIMGTYDDFYRPHTLCIPTNEGWELNSYISADETCNGADIKLFVLAKKTNSLVYKDTIASTTEIGYAVCIYDTPDITPPIITIISPQPIVYAEPNIDILIATNEKTQDCRFSLNGGAMQTMYPKNTANTSWDAIVNIPFIGKHNITVYCEDMASHPSSSSVIFDRVEEDSSQFNETSITIYLGEKRRINVFVQNQYDHSVVFNLTMKHDDAEPLPLTNFGWFEGHRSDLNKTNLFVQLSPGQSQIISYIQYGGLVGTGVLILNVKIGDEYIIKNVQKQVEIKTGTKTSFFASTPDIQTAGFVFVILSSAMIMLRGKKQIIQ